MKIVITIGEFKVEISDNTDTKIYSMPTNIQQIITSVVKDYNTITKVD